MPAIINHSGEAAAVLNGHIEAGRGIQRVIYYDRAKSAYWFANKQGQWVSIPAEGVVRKLRADGYSRQVPEGQRLSPLETRLMEIQEDNQVHYCGPLAGHWPGLVECNGTRALVTSAPKLVNPVAGESPLMQALLRGLLVSDGIDQRPWFISWLKVGEDALRNRQQQPGQVVCLAGPRECGKSLLQSVITEILGGRCARPHQYMSGQTPFNMDLLAAEHLAMEDDQPFTSIADRRNFGSKIKEFTVNRDQRLHQKGKDALTFRPFWRLTFSLNDEPENLMALPPLDESISDKLSLFHCTKTEMPMPCITATERAEFWSALVDELPAFVHWLRHDFTIPKELRAPRFSVRHFHHPRIVDELHSQSPETKLLDLIDSLLFDSPAPGAWEGTAQELQRKLTSGEFARCREAEKILNWSNAAAVFLSRLSHRYPDRIRQHRRAAARMWEIGPG